MTDAIRIVVMGPSGSGKSTVGAALAEHLGAEFLDADNLHPEHNVAKMRSGIPLEDADRWPWLDRVGSELRDRRAVVIACSALKRSYRDALRRLAPDAQHVELTVDAKLLARRMSARSDHFMPTTLLASQLDTLEPLEQDERGMRVSADAPVDELVSSVRSALHLS